MRFITPGTGSPTAPLRPVRRVYDDFERPDSAALGVTTGELKPWTPYGSATVRGRILNGRALAGTSGTGAIAEAVDANLSDCVVRTTIGAIGDRSGGVILRLDSAGNYLRLNVGITGTPKYHLYSVAGGTGTLIEAATSGPDSASGDLVEVFLTGTSIVVKINGTTIISTNSALYQTATKHGFLFAAGSTLSWNVIKVTAS